MSNIKASIALLEMLKSYNVKHVFGLPGETTLPWYTSWHDFPDIKHVLARDERSAAFMADAYSRLSFKPGVCEGPSVGSTHLIPGVAEAYKASVPMLIFTTDIPLDAQKRNMLTDLDQTSLYEGITKETITITKANEIPFLIRRAFRLMTAGRPGPVHIRIPMDILEGDVKYDDIYAQKDFSKYPGHRPSAETKKIKQALKLLIEKEKPVLICGQGTLFSQAWDEVVQLAEIIGIPVGTSMTGKGSIAETHPLSIGVTGARGGTSFSNKILEEADLIFYIGCDTDSATTDKWHLPSMNNGKSFIQLDICEREVGNNFPTDVNLIGDVKATLQIMIDLITDKEKRKDFKKSPRIKQIAKSAKEHQKQVKKQINYEDKPIHPMRFMKELNESLSNDHVIVTDPGVSAIYPSAFYKGEKPGRKVIFNYALGALGYAIPASVGAYYAKPKSCIIALTGDGSFGFSTGELETISRVGGNINVILFNNGSYGWIRAATRFSYESKYFDTEFKAVDYTKIAQGYGIESYSVEDPKDMKQILKKVLNSNHPTFVDIKVRPEDELVPPVPSWVKKAKKSKIDHVY